MGPSIRTCRTTRTWGRIGAEAAWLGTDAAIGWCHGRGPPDADVSRGDLRRQTSAAPRVAAHQPIRSAGVAQPPGSAGKAAKRPSRAQGPPGHLPSIGVSRPATVSSSGTDPNPGGQGRDIPTDPVSAEAPASYDLIAQQLIPGYASLARLAVSLLAASPLASAQGASVLVAGCGTGAELLEARVQRPDWRLTALDPSAAMLATSRQRLQSAPSAGAGSIRWLQSTVEELPPVASFDGSLSVLVLQSLADDGSKLAFLSSLARTLRPGGQLVLVDLMRPERSPLQAQVAEAWQGFQRASGLDGAAEALAALSPKLHPIGPARLGALVEAAGFGDPAPDFQALDFQGFLLQRRS